MIGRVVGDHTGIDVSAMIFSVFVPKRTPRDSDRGRWFIVLPASPFLALSWAVAGVMLGMRVA